MSSPPIVLIVTYPEHGQANVNLATSYELALAGVNIHIASFAPLSTRVSHLQELVDRHASRSNGKLIGTIVFHEIKGIIPNWDAQARCGIPDTKLPHPHGVSGAVESYAKMIAMLFAWDKEEYLTAIENVKEIITNTKPDVVGVDPLFFAAQDACKLADQKFIIILPNGLKEAARGAQPYLAAVWKYPILSSGFPFPLRWWQVPLNIYLYIRLVIQMITSPKSQRIRALRKSLGLDKIVGAECCPGVTYICPALPELDLPLAVIPKEILPCGPIVMPFDPLEESDPDLMKWLNDGPTVLVNLGSHTVSDEKAAREMVGAFRILLDYHDRVSSKIQVLWKVKADTDVQRTIDETIGKDIRQGNVKVVTWLDAEPVSILQHPNMVCTVHHGGANSFYEGIWSGVPHIVLPVWFDTYDYAQRAEFLNVGIFGNRTCAPGVRAEEFGTALMRVTGNGEEASRLKTSAKHLKEICRTKGNGRELASMAILQAAGIRI